MGAAQVGVAQVGAVQAGVTQPGLVQVGPAQVGSWELGDGQAGEVEIGWTFLARSHWGGLYNGEMKRLMIRHAFRFVESVVFLIGPQNLRSQRAVEKIGAVRDGSRLNGAGRESFVYRITAPTFR